MSVCNAQIATMNNFGGEQVYTSANVSDFNTSRHLLNHKTQFSTIIFN
jgi:hypothetical protein